METSDQSSEDGHVEALAAQAATRVLGNLVHGINNQLATLQGSIDLLERRLGKLNGAPDPDLARLLERASTAVQKSGVLTTRMRRLLREPEEERDIHGMLTELAELGLAGLGGPVLAVEAAEDLWPTGPATRALWPALLALAGAACDDLDRHATWLLAAANCAAGGSGEWVVVRLSADRPMPTAAQLAKGLLAASLARQGVAVRTEETGAIEFAVPAARRPVP